MTSHSTRRQFLKGQSAAQALGDLIAPGLETEENASANDRSAAETYLLQLGRKAMACQFEVFFNAGQYADAAERALEALDLIDHLEEQMTVYRDTSEISRVNRFAASQAVKIEARLFGLLSRAADLYRETEGAFDITSGPLSKIWGFFRRKGAVPNETDLAAALEHTGGEWLDLDADESTVRFRKQGMEINLGAIGKGYALDRVAERLVEAGIHDFLWHGGQSSVLARGTCGGVGTGGWMVDLRHPLRPERPVIEIRLRDRALGTSGAGTQFFRHGGRRFGHILDPRSGWPAEGVYSTTVVTASAAEADALATALYVLGRERALEWCRQRPDVGLLMFVPGAERSVELAVANLTKDDWRLTSEL